jgi:hypothetical protein
MAGNKTEQLGAQTTDFTYAEQKYLCFLLGANRQKITLDFDGVALVKCAAQGGNPAVAVVCAG